MGRFALELALGALFGACSGSVRIDLVVGVALAAAVIGYRIAAFLRRRSFLAAHLGLAGVALPPHVPGVGPLFAEVVGALCIVVAIELAHAELAQRRRIDEHLATLRFPSSVVVRRLGSGVIASVAARVSLPLLAEAAHPSALVAIPAVIGAVALLSAGFGPGPGRPIARPVDAAVFVLLCVALALRPA